MMKDACMLGLAAIALLSACDGRTTSPDDGGATGDPVEVVRATCEQRTEGPNACDEACLAAAGEANTTCGSEALMESPEWADFVACGSACPSARTCGEVVLIDCGCGAECLRARSDELVAMYAALAECVHAEVSGVCY